ncbi:MAG: hypothetical protein Q9192_002255 [Flavoplaca navasiana]
MSPMAEITDGQEILALEPIAICGMACRLPGGIDSDSSFWRMIIEKRSGQTPKVPKSRFNIDAHYHESPERPGSFNVAGGYFLDGRPEDFDPTFFNITPIEAQWLDPQQRKMLEVSYECLVSAGVTLQSISGSNTAVFVGSFTSDYQQMSIRDPDFRHNYAATGVDPGIISNRIGNTFNLQGPSFTINTACSSSVYALHNACHALRSRDCDAAIVGGVNLILTVDQHMNTAKLGILSPTSICHTFDESADGYGRAEGAGALYVKRLSDAIRDGDPVRGVVRSTAVNTNGKVDGMGITHPSAAGQERVVRSAYEKAELDPTQTAYAELHGTGTPVGDPIEVRAVSRAMNDTRSNDRPLLVGAVKPNIGHSEAASGIFAVIKASMMTEAALIPGIAYYKKLNPSILETEWNVKIHADTAPWPEDAAVRRASVSSFGYGGTNGHVIIESIENLHPWYQHAKSKAEAPHDRSSKKPFLLCFSAHDKTTLSRNVDAIGCVAANYYLTDLAHTLNLRRTMFSHRAFTIAYEGQETEAFASNSIKAGCVSTKAPEICFLFTGQGAQWIGMGRIALEFPVFRDTIEKLDLTLDKIFPKPSFKIAELLSGSDDRAGNRINDAEISQPLSTAVQIALVDLFQTWDIEPAVSIGHSSGEVGAAYAAGLISAPEAITVAFCRGRAVAQIPTSGSMLAVGLGAEDTQLLLPAASEDACIACENSPTSVTVSGTVESISQLRDALDAKGVFVRELKTGKAYHSPHMTRVGEAYEVLLADALCKLSEDDLLWRQSRSQMISSVTGEPVEADYLPLNHWILNLRQRVLFKTAVQRLGADDRWRHVSLVVEIGPHSALSGPFKQICKANGFSKFTYVPSMVRNRHDAIQLLSVAGSLFLAGYGVDLEEVNATSPATTLRKRSARNLLVDLPHYQWNYENRHWAEPRGSAEQRARHYPRHDLLGSRVSGLTTFTQIWRNVLRHRDIPWLKDHNLGGTAIFPAAGHLSVAIEALRQVHETDGEQLKGVTLRDVNIKTALVIPDNNDGVETILRLQIGTGKAHWHFFAVESLIDGVWTVHCEGRISAVHEPFISTRTPVVESALSQRVSGERWYSAFDRVGFYYGKTFRQLLSTRTDRSVHHATGDINVIDSSGVMQGESRYLVHPTTIDACLHLVFISVHAGKHKEMPWGVVPTRIEEVTLFPAEQNAASVGHAVAWTDDHDAREFNSNVQLKGADGTTLLGIKNLTCITYDAAVPASTLEGVTGPEPFSVVSWKPDVMTLTSEIFERTCPSASGNDSRLGKIVELITHRQHIRKLVICGSPGHETIEAVLTALPKTMTVTLAFDGEQELNLSVAASARTLVKTLPDSTDNWVQATDGPHDLVILDYRDHEPRGLADRIMPLVQDEGWLIGFMNQYPQAPSKFLNLGQHFALLKTETHMGHATLRNGTITILSLHGSSNIRSFILAASVENIVQVKSLDHFSPEQDLRVVIDDTANTLYSAICSDAKIFEALQRILSSGIRALWLTQGVRQGQSASAGMAEGLLRSIRSEQAAARIVLLDIDHGEVPQVVGSAIIGKMETADTKASGRDTEFWLHEGVLHIPRVYPQHGLNQTDNRIEERLLPRDLSLTAEIFDNQLVLRPRDRPTQLLDDEVEVQIQASEIQPSVSGTQLLVCGDIIRVGSSVDKTLVGSRIVTFSYDGLKTVVCTSAYAVVDGDEDRSPEALISTLLPLYPVVNLCLFRNNMTGNDFLVALPGPRSYVATITRMAKAMGWKLKVIVDSCEEKQDCILQYGLGPDQVLLSNHVETITSVVHEQSRDSRSGTVNIIAHDFSPLAEEIWRFVPAFCRFMITENSNAVAPDPLPFGRGAAFIPAHLKALRTSPNSVAGLLKLSLQVLKAYPDVSLPETKTSTRILDVADAGDSLIHPEQRNEAVIVRFGYGESQAKITHTSSHLRFAADATYLLVGCLGGLGRSLARWMQERGAKHFAFISRSGAAKPEAAELIERLKNSGATTQVYSADASDQDAVRRVVLDLQARGKIRGVVHAATTFKDGMFEQMDHQSFVDCAKAKAQSALSLHHAVRELDLDFFVMTSSISALLGNTGQSNYSAANSVLDALATQRRASRLPATSLVLPMVLDVGVVAENEALERSLARKGLYGIDEAEMLRGFELAMTHSSWEKNADSQLVMGFDARELARSAKSTEKIDGYWHQDARFCHARAAMTGDEVQAGRSGNDNFAATVQEAAREDPEAAITVISRYIAKRMSEILMIPLESLELDGPSLSSYGLDSMIGVEMRTWIFKEFGLDYPFQKLLAPTLTFRGLARVVAEKMLLVTVSQQASENIVK